MIPFLLLAATTVATPPATPSATIAAPRPARTAKAGPADPVEAHYTRCLALIRKDPVAARTEAARWEANGGGVFAQGCAGLAYAAEGSWASAAAQFEAAARVADTARDRRGAGYWAQAGNAWLAANEPLKARSALDAALSAHVLDGLALGEVELDHARALVAAGQPAAARGDIDAALLHATADPLAWLLSATLARRQGDLPRARRDIAEALKRSGDDASVQLEAGNIAALAGDEAGAREAWGQAARLAPDTPVGRSAVTALRQFDAGRGASRADAPGTSAPIGR